MKRKVLLIFIAFSLIGCARIQEAAKIVSGYSIKELEDKRSEAILKTLAFDYNTSFNKVKEGLEIRGCYIYVLDKKKHVIAAYVSQEDTTPVGVFFKEIDPNNTQIEVASPSKDAKEFIAKKLFSVLEGRLDTEEKKGQSDAKEELPDK